MENGVIPQTTIMIYVQFLESTSKKKKNFESYRKSKKRIERSDCKEISEIC